MKVHPSQLVPGCVVVKDLIGKTGRPIMHGKTVLTDELIDILHRFLIDEVEVFSRLEDGKPYIPGKKEVVEAQAEEKNVPSDLPFTDFYIWTVQQYKRMFTDWRNGKKLQINQVRKLIVPLLERVDEIGLRLYNLHKLSTGKDYFYHHAVMVGLLSAFLAKKSNYKHEWIQIGIAGFLADCGMAKIDDRILFKAGPLNTAEYEEIKKHPVYSYRFVETVSSLSKGMKLAILQHQERLDGSGYPLGVAGEKIHPYARFIAISDIYHAMTAERVYQKPQSPFKVIEEMLYEQFGKLDHPLVENFVSSLTNFGTGTKVTLSNKQQAEIVFIEAKHPTRPMVRLQSDQQVISLKDDRSLYIEEILS
ncbi:HD-GYP domain-containing protein [Sediminibacillus halophilus]|uniref:HD-GYP domain, c-di-GMP phosphodiesterase class II (Or its inactivated variant) n=1 Tax=Sediminibacillus halophilus TaxID=482461 RepID=A0A1G9SY52_9BACI|nr:HD-GYP domain-containing protein [Sediminibacillus halophilus]SDM40350.1 HD-GYP domain, c-di-GMP phosphodiesterase class II (or its inactivated variant) [Sediminibacillus halophilus]